jgi:hypothetical protein
VTDRFDATGKSVRRYRRLLSLLPERYLKEAAD